ncbi:MAG TPA: phosphoribosylaminoimidazolesuccinocarboxamide synthase [Saprospiraceae bacterium]|nr:phosphoribosylaminoimidazolesuccinocarboxamide synthase [Saprospiraceae bacterium]
MSSNITISGTDFKFKGQRNLYKGKVRDVYTIDDLLVMVATDRISAFDYILARNIPHKGQVLNQMASYFLKETANIIPNWWIAAPDPNVSIGKKCTPYKVEMVVRNYLVGHAWRTYKEGNRVLCGIGLSEGLKENQQFEKPILTPSTKADEGHDLDISREEIIARGVVPELEYKVLEKYSLELFNIGSNMAKERGLILVDTKYEFGKDDKGNILLIDEIHTPDSSRYFYEEDYADRFSKGLAPRQLSKEFVREWLIAHGFQGKEDQIMPVMPDSFIKEISERYLELYRIITGHELEVFATIDPLERIKTNIESWLVSNT